MEASSRPVLHAAARYCTWPLARALPLLAFVLCATLCSSSQLEGDEVPVDGGAATLWMPSHFASGMVLQTWSNNHMAARLYGRAGPNALVTAATSVAAWPVLSAQSGDDGRWAITFNLPPGSGTASFNLTVVSAAESLFFSDIVWGDVFACVGDASMLLPTSLARNGSSWLTSSPVAKWLEGDNVRLFAAGAAEAAAPQGEFSASAPCAWPTTASLPCNAWVAATAATASSFSALCLQTAAALALSAGNPGNRAVGLLQLAAPFMPVESLLSSDSTRACGPLPARTPPLTALGGLFNGTLAPMAFQTVRAVLLSHGGSDLALFGAAEGAVGEAYACTEAAAISGLRVVAGVGDPPALLPLLSAAGSASEGPGGAALFGLRMAQLAILPRAGGAIDTVAIAVSIDLGTESLAGAGAGAPPAATNTLLLAERLATALAYAGFWRFGVPAWGPVAASATSSGVTVTVGFRYAPDGNVSLPRLALTAAPGCVACCTGSGASAVLQLAASIQGPWTDARSFSLSSDLSSLVVVPPQPELELSTGFLRYGAAPPASPECFLTDSLTGLPAAPFLLSISAAAGRGAWALRAQEAGAPLRLSRPLAAASALDEAIESPPSSYHLVGPDGTFDRRAYLLHGRERAVAAAAALAAGRRLVPASAQATPPLGFNSWQGFRCNVDEVLMAGVARAFVSSGLLAAGYSSVNFDDCVMRARVGNGSLTEDEVRFPSTLFSLGRTVAGLGIGLGIYTSATSETCVGRPGSYAHEDVDTQRWCAWGVSTVKVDNCGGTKYAALNTSWIAIRKGLDAHCGGRPVVLSVETCSDPSSRGCGGWIRASGATMWRTTADLQLYYASVVDNLDRNELMAPLAGPGYFNDPDILIVGHPGLTPAEEQTHMASWALSAAPLLLSFDLTSPARLTPRVMALIANPEVLAVDQDAAVVQGVRATPSAPQGAECWARPLATHAGLATAVLLFNRANTTGDVTCEFAVVAPGVLNATSAATVRDLWTRADLGVFTGAFSSRGLPPHGSALITLVPVSRP